MNIESEIAELRRRIDNIIRIGVIAEVQLRGENTQKAWLCRVNTGNLTTNFIPWCTPRAGDARLWWAPSVGEQVMIFSISGNPETAIVGPSLFSDDFPPPSLDDQTLTIQFPDDALIQYNANAGALMASGMKTAEVEASESITAQTKQLTAKASVKIALETPIVECSDHLTAKTLSITEGGTMRGDINHTNGSFTSNGKVLHTHTHSGVERGGGSTDGPQ